MVCVSWQTSRVSEWLFCVEDAISSFMSQQTLTHLIRVDRSLKITWNIGKSDSQKITRGVSQGQSWTVTPKMALNVKKKHIYIYIYTLCSHKDAEGIVH